MRILALLLLLPLAMAPAYGAVMPTSGGTLDVRLETDPAALPVGEEAKLNVEFINPVTQATQIHIDYFVSIMEDGTAVFGPTNRIHTSEGRASIPIQFERAGEYEVRIDVDGILFNDIPKETVVFAIATEGHVRSEADKVKAKAEEALTDPKNDIPGSAVVLIYSNTEWSGATSGAGLGMSSKDGRGDGRFVVKCDEFGTVQGNFQKNTEGGYLLVYIIQNGKLLASEGTSAAFGIAHAVADNCNAESQPSPTTSDGGCLIATAAYGTELAPQVQQLREVRADIAATSAGAAFLDTFNSVYYSFSPAVADLERQSPIFKEAVRLAISPMLASLSVMDGADTEAEVLSYGIAAIALNIGTYVGIPLAGVFGLLSMRRTSRTS